MLLRNLFPWAYKAPLPEPKQEEQILIDWLERQVDEHTLKQLPVVYKLSNWRNKEVFIYIRDGEDWTKYIFGK